MLPFVSNWSIAILTFFFFSESFEGSADIAYWVIGIAVFVSFLPVGNFLLEDIGPIRTVFAILIQSGALLLTFAAVYSGFGLMTNGAPPVPVNDLDALYFSVVTWTTLGYGDFSPPTELRLIAAAQAAIGYFYLGLTVGLVANVVSSTRQ